jgi:predicted transcriptional regulator
MQNRGKPLCQLVVARILKLRREGWKIRAIAHLLRIAKSTVEKYIAPLRVSVVEIQDMIAVA